MGGKCVKIREPSIPSHSKVWCGKVLTWFHEIFWVRKRSIPASRAICGRAAEYPKESGSQISWQDAPSSFSKKSRPSTSWRHMASPPGRTASGSTHIPPTGTMRPFATRSRTRSKSSGSSSLSQAACWAAGRAKIKDEPSSMRRTTLARVRFTLRRVSRSGHNHAESMCACPTALIR